MDAEEAALAEDANRLYWSSDDSVNRIADDLGLSKGTLYALVQPVDASMACADCGADMTFANRTARDKGIAECPACGLETDGDEAMPTSASTALQGPIATESGSYSGLPSFDRRILAGTALLAVAVGLFIVGLTRRR